MAIAPSLSAAHADVAGSITITPNSGTPDYVCVNGISGCNFETTVTVTGTGFPSGQNGIDLCFVYYTTTPTVSCGGGIDLAISDKLFNPTIAGTPFSSDTVQADANGYFQVQFAAPVDPAGTYNVYAYYTPASLTPVMTQPVQFVLKAGMVVDDVTTGTTSGIPGQTFDVAIVGMAASENVQLIPSSFFTGTWTVTVSSTGAWEEDGGVVVTGVGSVSAGASVVPSLPTGSNLVEALGLSSGTIVSTTFSTTPAILVTAYSSGCPATAPPTSSSILSIPTAAGNKFCLTGFGFAKSAPVAAASSITVGGASTIESTLTSQSNGEILPLAVTLTNSAPEGPLTISFDGMNFNWANSNIIGDGILLGSNHGQGALTYMSETSGYVGDTVKIFGFGYCTTVDTVAPCASASVVPAFDFNGAVLALTSVVSTDANGAFEVSFTVPVLPYCPAVPTPCTPGYGVTDHETTDGNTAPSQTFTINPEASFDTIATPTPNTTLEHNSFGFTQALVVSGLAATDSSITVTMDGVTWDTFTGIASTGAPLTFILPAIGTAGVPDFPGGSYTASVAGTSSGNTATTTNKLTIDPIAVNAAGVTTLTPTGGNANTPVVLLSSSVAGLHGLLPDTSYSVMWDTTTQVATFTSTATGEVPIGVDFTVPAGTSGNHIVDIQSGGVSAIYGNILYNPASAGTQFYNLIYMLATSLIATPSAVGAGATVTATGSGLPANTLLYIEGPNSVTYASFTSTSSGSVPSGVSFVFPTIANPGNELGFQYTFSIFTTSASLVGSLKVIYQATMTLSSSVGPAGTTVTATANGLDANALYYVVFNYAPNSFNPAIYTGSVIGAISANAIGSSSIQITIPSSAASGTYPIGLVSTCPATAACATVTGQVSASNNVLVTLPTYTVGASTTVVGTGTLTPGTPTQTTLAGSPAWTIIYTNTLASTSISGFAYAFVTNALGEVVYYTTGSFSCPASSACSPAALLLAGLPHGTYSITIYALSSNNIVISTQTTASVTV